MQIDGQTNLWIDQQFLEVAVGEIGNYDKDLEIKCTVKEELTGEIMKGDSSIKTVKHNLKLETVMEPEVYKPGFGYKAIVSCLGTL